LSAACQIRGLTTTTALRQKTELRSNRPRLRTAHSVQRLVSGNCIRENNRLRDNAEPGIRALLYDPFIVRYKDDPRFAAFFRKVGRQHPQSLKG